MVKYEIVSERDVVIVRIYDAPANGWRTLFVEKDGVIVRYRDGEVAISDVRIYDSMDKNCLFEAENEVYLISAETGKPLGNCGLPSLVQFGKRERADLDEQMRKALAPIVDRLKQIGKKGK
jgi:hypothetical protein